MPWSRKRTQSFARTDSVPAAAWHHDLRGYGCGFNCGRWVPNTLAMCYGERITNRAGGSRARFGVLRCGITEHDAAQVKLILQ